MAEKTPDRSPNRLIHETSPYLLQHAYNPVDWYPWGEEALALAKAQDKPILLSIGYSACHWCHVMERESFENETIAQLMNHYYICVKVDREERPDLDEIYMQATIAMNQGNGGWPMTVFLTPDQQPIFAGTYFPPTDKWGRPGFPTILKKIAEAWQKDRDEIMASAARFTSRLQKSLQIPSPISVGQPELEAGVEQFTKHFDPHYGGFGQAPKFPPATGLAFLLRQFHHSGDEHVLHMVTKTLKAMAAGGIYDHIGGGFARYSTDERWLVPHFEKMLYDNALLAKTYSEAYQVTQDPHYRRIATEILDYIIREMTSPEGGFYSATDADSEGIEGKFFVWDPDQIAAIAPTKEDATRFCAYFDITESGNWEHHSIPNTPRPLEDVAQELNCTPDELRETIDRMRPLVYHARRQRIPPGLDDKIITAWNGMMISAMAEAARIFGEPRFLQAAVEASSFLLHTLSRPDGGLYRTYRAKKAHIEAYLEDYAFFIEALIDVYEAGGGTSYIHEALRLAERLVQDFVDEEHGGFFTTAKHHEPLILRSREGADGATPSGNAVAAMALARLSFHFNREDLRDLAIQAIRAYGRQIAHIPRGFAKTLMALDFLLKGPMELVLVGSPDNPQFQALQQELRRHFIPNRVIAYLDPSSPDSSHPLVKGKTLIAGNPALYICRNFTCEAPITDPQAMAEAFTRYRYRHGTPSSPSMLLQSSRMAGHATPTGTGRYVSRILAQALPQGPTAWGFSSFGSTGLTNSRIGFGGYRITDGEERHADALQKALMSGCNLIDTSTNYTDGASERLIGQVLKTLVSKQELAREEVIVVSKIGYVQGQTLARAEAKEAAGHPYPEMVKYEEGLWHCLHPDFLEDQLNQSLDRLGLETLDVCLLHNPEYFLSDAKKRNLAIQEEKIHELREEFYRRLQQAFAYLEDQVKGGRIQYYGVSSNTCTAPANDPEAISFSRMLEAAQTAAQSKGQASSSFRVLQLPMNLFEASAGLTRNTGPHESQTVLEVAQEKRIAILVNRPLNAIRGKTHGMLRLADPPTEPVDTTFESLCELLLSLEKEFCDHFAPSIPYAGQGIVPNDFFSLTEELQKLRPQLHSLEQWDHLESRLLAPRVNQALQVVTKHLDQDKAAAWNDWQNRYIPNLLKLFQFLRNEAAGKNRQALQVIRNSIAPLLPEPRRTESFSRIALWVIASTPGVTCVLNGMRTPEYVDDSLAVLGWEPLSSPDRVLTTLASS